MAVPLEYRHPPEPTVRGKPETAKLPKCTEATQSETTQQGQQSQKGDQGAAASEGPCESGQDKGEGQSGFAEEEGRVTPSPTRSPVTQVEQLLNAATSQWAFNAYELDQATDGHALSTLSYWLLQQTGLIDLAGFDRVRLVRFLQQVEKGYPDSNPFHNARHAATVLHATHMLVTAGGMVGGYADNLTRFSAYLAAIVHDFGHVGRSNEYLVLTNDKLALRYNDVSPLENHHVASAFRLLQHPDLNFLTHLPARQTRRIRRLVIDLILATDMKRHFAILGQFQALHDAGPTTNADSQPGPVKRVQFADTDSSDETPQPLEPISDSDAVLSLQLVVKCADLSHLAAPLHVHMRWLEDQQEEFYQQGDDERRQDLPVSALCDRHTPGGVYKSQVGFGEFVSLPLFRSLAARFPGCAPFVAAAESLHAYWSEQSNNA